MRRNAEPRGMTLLELLAVVVIFSLLLGFSVAILQNANKDLGVSAAANVTVSLLRAAREQARASSSPAWILLNPAQNTLRVLMKETIGEWHLEDANGEGAFGKIAKINSNNGTPVPARVGKGVLLAASGSISCGDVPVYEAGQGVSIELWFLRRSGSGRGVLATVGGLIEIASEADGRISVKAGAVSMNSGANRLPRESWCRLQFVHSGREVRLSLNGREVARGTGALDWPGPLPFTIGGQGFGGIVDEIRLGLVIPRNEYQLPAECAFAFPEGLAVPKEGDVVIPFDAEGRLELAEEFKFSIRSSATSADIKIGPGGTIQR